MLKPIGQPPGWLDVIHVAIDDTRRLAYVEILEDEKATTCVGFLRRAIAWFADHGITVERVMTDNGPGYKSKIHAEAVADLEIKHLRTRPYRPSANGKPSGHQDPPSRVGLRRQLPELQPPSRRAPGMAQLLEQPTTTQRPRPQDPRQPHRAELTNAPGIYT